MLIEQDLIDSRLVVWRKRRASLCVCPAAVKSPSCPVHGRLLAESWARTHDTDAGAWQAG